MKCMHDLDIKAEINKPISMGQLQSMIMFLNRKQIHLLNSIEFYL